MYSPIHLVGRPPIHPTAQSLINHERLARECAQSQRFGGLQEKLSTLVLLALMALPVVVSAAQPTVPASDSGDATQNKSKSVETQNAPQAREAQAPRTLFVREYRVEGAHQLPRVEVERAVYPFLGPARTEADVEGARAALEKAYQSRGFQTVSVQLPAQDGKGGIVFLQVLEGRVGRLRVRGAHYFSPAEIKAGAPSLAEGKVVNFNDVTRDIVALNQRGDRQVTPSVRAGVDPGTVDVDLNVKDSLPLHGSLELNNRYSANTTPLRVNGSLSYGNLWQLGHSIGASYQLSPEKLSDVKVLSGYYSAPVPTLSWLTLTLQGTKQDSNVSSLGGINSVGKGETIGIRGVVTLPTSTDFYHSLSLGLDYKHMNQASAQLEKLGLSADSPLVSNIIDNSWVRYYPFSVNYDATWNRKGSDTNLNAGIYFHVRGMAEASGTYALTGSQLKFENVRYKADDNYIFFRGDLSHTHDLPGGFQLFGKLQGQIANEPLIPSEQYSAGGLDTVRGYLESEVVGDDGIVESVELRTPSLASFLGKRVNEWRFHIFADAARLTVIDPLPDQTAHFDLASVGVGSRVQFLNHLNGSIDIGLPLISQGDTTAHDLLFTFRLWADF